MQEFSAFGFVSLAKTGDSSSFHFICTHAKAYNAKLDTHLNHQSQDFTRSPYLYFSVVDWSCN